MSEANQGARTNQIRFGARGRWGLAVFVCIAASWLITAAALVMLPEPRLMTNLFVDDAIYYALPAKNLVAGRGFSFDGLEWTNGVQTLWALVCVVLAWLVPDGTDLVRVMIALGAAAWFGAAIGIWRWLLPRSWPAAVFAASGLLWSGLHRRVAFQGMENGLHALIGVGVLFAGTKAVANRWTRASTLWLGLALALFGLSRTEAVIAGPLFALPLLCGRLGAPAGFWRRVVTVLWLAAPGIVLVGGAMVLSKLAFGCWLPISGSVKQVYERDLGGCDTHGGLFACLAWHLQYVFKLSIGPLRDQIPDLLAAISGLGYRFFRNLMWALLAVGAGFAIWRRTRIGSGFFWSFAGYALLHLLLMASSLPNYTSYTTWYFASESTVVWLLLGLGAAVACRRWPFVPVALALVMVPAGIGVARDLATDESPNVFREAGEWFEDHVPPGSRIGALSSGWVAWYAPRHHVINLDGLINDRRYLDDYLRPGRIDAYFADRRIGWFADYQTCDAWRNGLSWRGNVPARRMVPRRYWRMRNREAYVAWQVLPEDANFAPLGAVGPPERDRHVELAVAADVHRQFDVVAEGEVGDRVIARSLVVLPHLQLEHVVATKEQLADIALTRSTVHPDRRIDLRVADGIVLLGCDVVRSSDRIAVTLFWSCEQVPEVVPSLLLESDVGERVAVGDCRGTLPISRWPAGRVVVETQVVRGSNARLLVAGQPVELTR